MLLFQLQAARMGMNPNWRIKITQLECGTSKKDFSSMQSALATMYQKHKNKKNNAAKNDEDLLGKLKTTSITVRMARIFVVSSSKKKLFRLSYSWSGPESQHIS